MIDIIRRYGPPNNKLDLSPKDTICEVVMPDGKYKAIYVQTLEEEHKAYWDFIDIIPIDAEFVHLLDYTLPQ